MEGTKEGLPKKMKLELPNVVKWKTKNLNPCTLCHQLERDESGGMSFPRLEGMRESLGKIRANVQVVLRKESETTSLLFKQCQSLELKTRHCGIGLHKKGLDALIFYPQGEIEGVSNSKPAQGVGTSALAQDPPLNVLSHQVCGAMDFAIPLKSPLVYTEDTIESDSISKKLGLV
ncbi:conserved hypothetical protein [Ricinus communis]|uniref:Uncharacterized protein n=1 Tax=Ricinus communis TaxID=3988 RepID=B9RPZ3_RICCO|nr:conserved hypothetical protein [Ricinus communis]